MQTRHSFRSIFLLWLAWAVILIGYQAWAAARFQPARPDYAVEWTQNETKTGSQNDKPYLLDPFMNQQVSWDSEYYISISIAGYDDPTMRTTPPRAGPPLSLNYAFFPLYPYLMRVGRVPCALLGFRPIAASTLAGVIVSLLGTLGAMVALYDLARDELEESGALRAAFYLLVFPAGFFLAMVYTEGLFVGLAFGSLALMRHKRLLWAALLAALAVWTRAVGVGLAIPLALAWWSEARDAGVRGGTPNDARGETSPRNTRLFGMPRLSGRTLARGLLVLIPIAAYIAWRAVLGARFDLVEHAFFSRGALIVIRSWRAWLQALSTLWGPNPQGAAYYAVEFSATILALVACALTLRRYPGLALFGLFVVVISLTSGVAQGMHRYVLAVPSLFIVLGRWGRHRVFDRAWTLASTLVMGTFAYLYAFDMWAG